MIDVALLSIIRRWHIRDQVPLREIARKLGISRNTVRRYLRSEMTEPTYQSRRSPSAIDKYAFQLSALLKSEALKSRKQRRTLKQLHEELKELGFEGSYDRVAAFARVWRAGQTDRVNSASKRTTTATFFDTGRMQAHYQLQFRKGGPKDMATSGNTIHIHGIHGGQVQIGDHNTQNIVNALRELQDRIDRGGGTPEQKHEAKGLLRNLLAHPLVTSVLGGLAGLYSDAGGILG